MKYLSVKIQKTFKNLIWFKYIFLNFNIIFFYKIQVTKMFEIFTITNILMSKNIEYRMVTSKFMLDKNNKYFNFLNHDKYLLLYMNDFKNSLKLEMINFKLFAVNYYGYFVNNNYLSKINNYYLFYSNNYYFTIKLCSFTLQKFLLFFTALIYKLLNIIIILQTFILNGLNNHVNFAITKNNLNIKLN